MDKQYMVTAIDRRLTEIKNEMMQQPDITVGAAYQAHYKLNRDKAILIIMKALLFGYVEQEIVLQPEVERVFSALVEPNQRNKKKSRSKNNRIVLDKFKPSTY